MNLFFKQNDEIIYPGNRDQTIAWTKKWRITDEQLANAIIQTGSVNTRVLRAFLIEHGFLFSFRHFLKRLFQAG